MRVARPEESYISRKVQHWTQSKNFTEQESGYKQGIKVVFVTGYSNQLLIFARIIEELNNLDAEIKCTVVKIPSELSEELSFFEKIIDKRPIAFARHLLKREQPDIVVTGGDQGVHTTIIKICRMHDIPTLAVQDGILSERDRIENAAGLFRMGNYLPWRILSLISRSSLIEPVLLLVGWRIRCPDWGLGGVSRIAVFGEQTKKLLVKRGMHPNQIIITGYPLLDDVPKEIANFDKASLSQKLKLKSNEKLAILATQPLVEDGYWKAAMRETLVNSVVNASKCIKNLRLVIKLHPREDIHTYEKMVGNRVIIVKEVDLHKLLLSSDVVLTINSTVGLWALAYKKPLVTLNCFPSVCDNPYKEAAITVNNLNDLSTALRNAIGETTTKESVLWKSEVFLREHIWKLDGNASRRIAKLILLMAGLNAKERS